MPRAERRRRGDLVAAAGLVLAAVVAATLVATLSPAANTTSVTATDPVRTAPPGPAEVPESVTEAWRAPSQATTAPVVVGPVVVTGDSSAGDLASGGTVLGRDPVTGEPRWSYSRELPLCTVSSGWGLALSVFRNGAYCGEVTSLQAATGARGPQRNADVRPGIQLLDDGNLVTAAGSDYLETWRSDLVKTLHYGAARADAQPDRQPRPQCRHPSVAVTDGRLGVLERCPGESGDRLTMLRPDGNEPDRPEEQFSVVLPTAGARLVALASDREAVLLPAPTRLSVLGEDGAEVASHPLDLPVSDLVGDPPGGVVPTTDSLRAILWWTGSRTIALDVSDLRPLWTVPDSLGPGALWAGRLVVPVVGGLAVLNADDGSLLRTVPVDRGDHRGPVAVATIGPVLLEQRGPTVVALS